MLVQDIIHILFVFMLGACIGSFLNVVVWRLPRVEIPNDTSAFRYYLLSFKALSDPPSHCPQCNNRLKWYDNIPIFGWIKLRGKCRFCKKPISKRYPIIELITALLFVGYYVAYYMLQVRNCCPLVRFEFDMSGMLQEVNHSRWIWSDSWPIYLLYMVLISGILAASLIDAELYIIPMEIPYTLAIVGFVVHSIVDRPPIPGALNLVGPTGPALAALAAGSALGLILSIALLWRGIIPTSFVEGAPLLDIDHERLDQQRAREKSIADAPVDEETEPEMSARQIRAEISREMLFLLPPMLLGGGFLAATVYLPSLHSSWQHLIFTTTWLNALLGSLLGAMVGGFVVWIIRILGTLGFGRVAMGLGDVHLMFGVGAIIGGSGAAAAFFIAPFCAILTTLYRLIARKSHEIPLGPYLSMATALVMLFYCQIMQRVEPGFEGLLMVAGQLLHLK